MFIVEQHDGKSDSILAYVGPFASIDDARAYVRSNPNDDCKIYELFPPTAME